MSRSLSATALLGESEIPVKVRRVIKVAPCGCCGAVVNRDEMWAMNTKFFSPDDKQERKVNVRLCSKCVPTQISDLKEMEWDNSSMKTIEVDD